ncbi:MAG: hypothetical protein ACM3PC_10060 [Deltaproteobacteria bacterium]
MRLRWIGVGLLALSACAQSEAGDVVAPAPPREDVLLSRAEVGALAGYVTAREEGVLKLDSGGPIPIELHVDPSARVMRDGRTARAGDILPGDVVRAAVRSSDDGHRVGLQIFANSRPVSQVQNVAEPAQQPQARRAPPLRRNGR